MILFDKAQKWHSRRKMLTSTFHFKTLETYIPAFNKHAQLLTKGLEKMSGNGQQISIYPFMTLCALDIVCGMFINILFNYSRIIISCK